MQLLQEQVKEALNNNGASYDFKTGKTTTKRGFLVSQKDTEATIQGAHNYNVEDLTLIINEILKNNTYNDELNKKNILGLWIDENDTLYIDISKCINVSTKDIYKVKNEAILNNQYSVYNNETGKTYKLIIPIYTLYKTSELLGYPTSTLTGYSKDFYNVQDIADYFNSSKANVSQLIYNSVDDIQEDYNNTYVIIKDLTNYTRDIQEDDITLTIQDISKYSRLIEA